MRPQIYPTTGRINGPVYHLKVILIGSKPAIWRRLQVPGNANLGWLHAVIQVAMGWTNSHLHHFLAAGTRYSDPRHNDEIAFGAIEERSATAQGAWLNEEQQMPLPNNWGACRCGPRAPRGVPLIPTDNRGNARYF